MALTKVQNTGIADDAITTDKIENSTVVAADLAASSVTNAKIATGTIGNAKLTNSSITVNGSSISLGGSGSVKHIDWQAVTVADGSTQLTAEAGKGYFLDTNTGVIEVFLPSSPSRGDTIVLVDYGGTFATNKAIVNTGGKLIDSTEGPDFKLTTNNTIAEFVFVDDNKGYLVKLNQAAGTTPDAITTAGGSYDVNFLEATGGTVTTSGDFKIHTFTGDANFIVSSVGQTVAEKTVSYVVVAGGGGGGAQRGGGGGAGGFREGKVSSDPYTDSPLDAGSGITVTATTFPITVGAGGAAGAMPSANSGSDGSNSIFSTITSTGGGGGGAGPTGGDGRNGGSGGGSGSIENPGSGDAPGNGNTPPVSPAQGTNGGPAAPGPSSGGETGAGGGGATQAGLTNPASNTAGDGGDGATTSITGSPTAYAGGGAGGNGTNTPTSGGGTGGGGPGGGKPGVQPYGTQGQAGTANLGGGGGGGGDTGPAGGAGGKGVVILRYKFQ